MIEQHPGLLNRRDEANQKKKKTLCGFLRKPLEGLTNFSREANKHIGQRVPLNDRPKLGVVRDDPCSLQVHGLQGRCQTVQGP